jgi:DNA-binding NarL/FixJ family response regulator
MPKQTILEFLNKSGRQASGVTLAKYEKKSRAMKKSSEVAQIIRLHKKGVDPGEISELLDLSLQTVNKVIKNNKSKK